jgi:hypothetical protein
LACGPSNLHEKRMLPSVKWLEGECGLMHLRTLLVLATLCWVAPLSAQQRASAPDRAWACPHALESKEVVILAHEPFGEVPIEASRRAFLP